MHSYRKIAAIAVAASMSVALSACGNGGSDNSAESKTVVIYSNSVDDGRGDWLAEQAKDAGFDLQIVDLGGGDIMNRLISEKANPVADVTFGLNGVYFEKLKQQGVLAKTEPIWAEQVGDSSKAGEGYFWPLVTEPIMLVYNVATYPNPEDAPKDWPDLWEKAEYHDQYEVTRSLGGATVQMVISGILSRYRDDEGHLGVSQAGWDAIAKYYEYANVQEEGIDLYARMADGTVSIGQMWLAGKIAREKQYGVNTEAVHPEIGVPMVTQSIAMIEGAKHPEAAKEFVDWFGGADLQSKWSHQFGTAPVGTEAKADGDQEIIDFTNSFKTQDIDWSYVAEHIDDWVEEIELKYHN